MDYLKSIGQFPGRNAFWKIFHFIVNVFNASYFQIHVATALEFLVHPLNLTKVLYLCQ